MAGRELRVAFRSVANAVAGFLLVLAHVPGAAVADPGGTPAVDAPALVVMIAIDQLRRDRLDPELPGGLGRLAREGSVYLEGVLDHATSETCPGHATMLTGRHPGPAGIPGNTYIDRSTGDRVYCVEDHGKDAVLLGRESLSPTAGRSPRNLRVGTLGDWMKARDPDTRVFAISAKDRSAITLAGHRPNAAYWFVRDATPGFTSSRYYMETLPAWVTAWNGAAPAEGIRSRVPEAWTHATEPLTHAGWERADDFEGESDKRGRTSPHPLHDDDPEELADNVYASPYMDMLTLDFALALLENEPLGERGSPDLLAISFSAIDTVGHAYGPRSLESDDGLRKLDLGIGRLLDVLERRLGAGRVLVALTADHGVLQLPEWLEQTGESECPVAGSRQGLAALGARFAWRMHYELSLFSWPRAWVNIASQVSIDRELARDRDVPIDKAIAVAEHFLEAQTVVRAAWTQAEILASNDPIGRLYRNSLDLERSGDLALQLEPTCLIDYTGAGTTHGSPYLYDRAVPLLFWGPGIPARQLSGAAATIDIAPTLAGQIGLSPPPGLDGRDLLAN